MANKRWKHEEAQRKAEAQRVHRESEEIVEEADLMRMAIALEGERSFFKWWDDDTQVPHYASKRERIGLLKKRLNLHEE